MGPPTPLETFPPSAASGSSPPIEMDFVPADNALFPSIQPNLFGGTTVAQERRESIARPGASTKSAESIPRRLSKSFQESDFLPHGFLAATADMTSSMVAAARPRSGTARTRSSTVSDPDERNKALQQQRTPSKGGDGSVLATLDEQKHLSTSFSNDDDRKYNGDGAVVKQKEGEAVHATTQETPSDSATENAATVDVAADAELFTEYDNGYHFPPKYSKSESFKHFMLAFWHYVRTPVGFLVVLYGLNIVAWGGMLFLLLCDASPAMCHPTCNDINSPRRKWIEYDSQILTALFCVTGFGLAPWRFRDMYFYLQYRLGKDQKGLRRLAGVHRGWLRLPGSQELPASTGPGNVPPDTPVDAIPFPESKISDAPLTGRRAPPTRMWAIVFVLGMNIANTFLQAVLCGFMWGMNRYNRPSWSTGLFVALGCLAGAFGGLGMFVEGKRVKGIEGVPLTNEDREKLAHDRELGVYHYNNLSGKKPKEKTTDVEVGQQ